MSDFHNTAPNVPDDDIYHVPDDLLEAKAGTPPSYPSGSHRPKKGKGDKKRWIIVGIVVVVLGLGGGAYALFGSHKKPKTNTAATSTTSSSGTVQADTNAGTKQYTSSESTLSLSFNYPTNWQVSPATTTSAGTQTITITSVPDTFVNAAGASVTGKAIVTIRPGSAGIDELTSGTATIAQNSVQMGYTHPAADQHQYPYLTFIHLANGSSAAGAFEEVMITGVSSFSKGGSINTADLAGLDPVISVAFSTCVSSACTGTGSAMSINNATWTSNATLQEVQTLLDSLVLN